MGFFDTIGLVATGLNSANAEGERLRKLEQDDADVALERAQRFISAGNPEAGVRVMKPAAKLYGLNMPDFKNTMTTEQVAAPGIGNAMPPDQMPTPGTPTPRFGLNPSFGAASLPDLPKMETIGLTRDSGRVNWEDPGNIEKARRYVGMPAPKPEYFNLSPGEVRYRQLPGKAPERVASAAPKPMADKDPRYDIDPVTGEVKPVVPGTRFGVKPDRPDKPDKPAKDTSWKDYQKAYTEWQQRGASYVNDYVSLMARNSQRTRVQNGVTMTVPPTPEQMKAWREEGARLYRETVDPPVPPGEPGRPDPFANPGGGKAAAARRGVPGIAPPSKYEDVALLPEWEGHLQAALKVAPGVEISSRARSVARNAKAKPGGGAPNSWHTHRQAFDIINYTAEQKAKLRAWAASEGLHMIDEGNHLHFQPAAVSDAGQAPALVAFYEKHGIKPGAANA